MKKIITHLVAEQAPRHGFFFSVNVFTGKFITFSMYSEISSHCSKYWECTSKKKEAGRGPAIRMLILFGGGK